MKVKSVPPSIWQPRSSNLRHTCLRGNISGIILIASATSGGFNSERLFPLNNFSFKETYTTTVHDVSKSPTLSHETFSLAHNSIFLNTSRDLRGLSYTGKYPVILLKWYLLFLKPFTWFNDSRCFMIFTVGSKVAMKGFALTKGQRSKRQP